MLNNKEKIEELEKASKPLVEFVNKYCCPHDCVVVKQGNVFVMSGEMSIPSKIED